MLRPWMLLMLLYVPLILAAIIVVDHEDHHGAHDVEKLFRDYFQWKLKSNPQKASMLGFNNYSDQVDDYSLQHLKYKLPAECGEFRQRGAKILVERGNYLQAQKKHHLRLLVREAQQCDEGAKDMGYLLAPINFVNGIQVTLPRFLENDNLQKLETLEDFKVLIQRVREIPKQIDQIIDLLQRGIEEGIVYPREALTRVQKQFDTITNMDLDRTFVYKQFEKLAEASKVNGYYTPAIIRFKMDTNATIRGEILPAIKKLEKYIMYEYSLHLRNGTGLIHQRGGLSMYQSLIEYHTTLTGITPEDIYARGLDEIRVQKLNLASIAEKLGYGQIINLKQFLDNVRQDQQYKFTDGNAAIQYLKDVMQKIRSKLGSIFGDDVIALKGMAYVDIVKAPTIMTKMASYKGPSVDGKRSGVIQIDLDNLEAWRKFESIALILHETFPGHHLEVSFERQSTLPDFIKYAIAFWHPPGAPPVYTAFREGWSLYAEYLGHEMNLYEDDPIQLIGYYSMNLLRAARQVVDTGLHVYGWSRQKSIDFLLDNTAMSYSICEHEVDRYLTIPGEATAAKVGEKYIRDLRQTLEAERGQNFDLRNFHKSVLECVGPLDTLEDCVRIRMNVQKTGTTTGISTSGTRSTTTTTAPSLTKPKAPHVVKNSAGRNHMSEICFNFASYFISIIFVSVYMY